MINAGSGCEVVLRPVQSTHRSDQTQHRIWPPVSISPLEGTVCSSSSESRTGIGSTTCRGKRKQGRCRFEENEHSVDSK
jgi:hypothetical protein